MSGGHFEYKQYEIDYIAEEIEEILRKEYPYRYEYNPESTYQFPPEVRKEMEKGLKLLKKAAIYAQRIDWFLSGDDGEENFLKRLKEDLKDKKL